MTYHEMVQMCQKKNTENDPGARNLIGHYVWYPLSHPITYALLNTKITPNQVSFLSLICCIIGFGFLGLVHTLAGKITGVFFFVLWILLDCVDGNLARVRKQFSPIGDLWDAAAGYAAICLMFFGMGLAGYDHLGSSAYLCAVLGALSAIFTLYPRLLMHFRYHGEDNAINDKREYGFLKMFIFNLSAPDCFVVPFMLIAVLFRLEFYFTCFYCLLNGAICLYSSYNILKE